MIKITIVIIFFIFNSHYSLASDDNHQNPHALFNLANTHFSNDQIGDAMAALLAARYYAPRDLEIRANLNFINGLAADKLDTDISKTGLRMFFFYVDWFSEKELFYAASFFAFLFLVSLLLLKIPAFRALSVLMLFLTAFFTLSCAVKINTYESWGALNSKTSVGVYSGPSDTHSVLFRLEEGAPVVILRQENSWYLIELSDGKRGWVDTSSVTSYLWGRK